MTKLGTIGAEPYSNKCYQSGLKVADLVSETFGCPSNSLCDRINGWFQLAIPSSSADRSALKGVM